MWVRPSMVCGGLTGDPQVPSATCKRRALGGGGGVALGLCTAGRRLRGQRIRPGSPTGSPVPKWAGKELAIFPSIPPPPLRVSTLLLASNCGWVPLGVGTPPLHQPPLRGASPVGLAFTFPLPSLPLTPSGQAWLEGGSVGRGSGPGSQQAPRGPSGQGKRWPPSFLILCPPNGPPLSPSRRGIPSPPPAAL